MATVLSAQSLQQLRQSIDEAMSRPLPAAPAAQPMPPGAPPDFCTVWPTAKPILQGIAGIIGLFPGFGPGAAAALAALLTVGDQVFNATCKK